MEAEKIYDLAMEALEKGDTSTIAGVMIALRERIDDMVLLDLIDQRLKEASDKIEQEPNEQEYIYKIAGIVVGAINEIYNSQF